MALECTVCGELIDDESRSPFLNGRGDAVTKLLACVIAGCCPACGTQVTATGQTPDEIIERYCAFLQSRQK